MADRNHNAYTRQGSHGIPWPAFVTDFHDTELFGRWLLSVTIQIAKYNYLIGEHLFFVQYNRHGNPLQPINMF